MAVEWDVPLQGDVEAACVDILDSNIPLATLFPGLKISTDLVGYQEGDQYIMIARKGGNSSPWQKVDKPRLDFNVYGDTRANAIDIAQLALKAMFEAQTNYVGKGVKLQTVKVESGLSRIPDRLNESFRYVMALRLTVTPE